MSAVAAVGVRSYGWEWLKWLAFGAMVADHIAVFFMAGEFNVLRHVGRFAFPVFCLTFGVGLARTRDPLTVARRLAVPALLAGVAWSGYMGVHFVNVLGVFLLCALVVAAWRVRWEYGAGAGLVVLALSPILEGFAFGPLLVASGFAFSAWGRYVPALVVGAVFASGVGSPLVAFSAVLATLLPQPAIAVPRVPGLLLWGYPLHLLALGMMRFAVS